MRGDNPKRPPEKGDGKELAVVSVFPTLQGEGPNAGVPAVFVRLGGCNLACDFCDTEFETFKRVSLDDLLGQIELVAQNEHGDRVRLLVVITGGEPLRQNIVPLCEKLGEAGYDVQIETNGTLYQELPEAVEIICSPKITGGKYHPVRDDLLSRIDAFKFIVSAGHPDYRSVAEVGQSRCDAPVYVQPMDEDDQSKNRKNIILAMKLSREHGYRLSLQLHKILGID